MDQRIGGHHSQSYKEIAKEVGVESKGCCYESSRTWALSRRYPTAEEDANRITFKFG